MKHASEITPNLEHAAHGDQPKLRLPRKAQSGVGTRTHVGAAIPVDTISPEKRQSMIATTAYYRAERRGFAPGCELEDWCAAEAEIDQATKHG